MIQPLPIRFQNDLSPATGNEPVSSVFYCDAKGTLRAGYWSSLSGFALDLIDHYNEFCFLLDGAVSLTAANGQEQIFRKGDSFLIPEGFTGRWKTLENCRKFFVIHDDRRSKEG